MHCNTIASIVAIATLAITTSAKGINCQGSALCSSATSNGGVAQQLKEYIDRIDTSRYYNNGEQIACDKVQAIEGTVTICAFLQNSNGAPGSSIKGLAHYIPDHGCTVCGSVPLFYPDDNNVDNGELTFNVVGSGCGNDGGLC
jgi:hypothetical protein